MQQWKIELLLLCKFAYLIIILWGPHVKSNWSKNHVFLTVLCMSLLEIKKKKKFIWVFLLLVMVYYSHELRVFW